MGGQEPEAEAAADNTQPALRDTHLQLISTICSIYPVVDRASGTTCN